MQIDQMASIYSGAICCLVFDAELMTMAMTPTPLGRLSVDIGRYTERFQHEETSPQVQHDHGISQAGNVGVKSQTISLNEASQEASEAICVSPQGGSRLEASANNGIHPNPDCQCVDIALQKKFFDLFCDDNIGLVTVWNELAGRSTTMAGDVPFILANALSLQSRPLFRFDEPYEMFLAILLSLGSIPLSIFFNAGVTPTCLIYRHEMMSFRDEDERNIKFYTIKSVAPLRSRAILYCESEQITYLVERPVSDQDQMDLAPFTSSLIMIGNYAAMKKHGAKHGGCFHVQGGGIPTRSSTYEPGHAASELELTFFCLLQLQRLSLADLPNSDFEGPYLIEPLVSSIDLKIKYDPLQNFQRLKKRDDISLYISLIDMKSYGIKYLVAVYYQAVLLGAFLYSDHTSVLPEISELLEAYTII
ncbi:hypothetical protein F5Y16DRAFT_416872 [Xylariaceae sp. FL0255]|nr:hypothetical protein F5Y16DRAFT_416872 [Xylariaceae sp. FL0255]